MKISEVAQPIKYELPSIAISTNDFVRIICETADEKQDISLLIGETFRGKSTLLENLDEIKQHSSIIRTPLTLKLGDVTLECDEFKTVVTSPNEDAIAEALATKLKSYRKVWFYRISQLHVWLAVGISSFVHLTNFDEQLPQWVTVAISVAAIPLAMLYIARLIYAQSKVFHSEQESWWVRNRDQLVTGAILLLFGYVLGQMSPNLFDTKERLLRSETQITDRDEP